MRCTMGMQIPVEELSALAFKGRAKTLLERLKALPWKQLSLRDDLDSLRRVLQALEATKGVRVAHRFVSRKVLSAAKRLRVQHAQGHNCALSCVAISPDGTRFATSNLYHDELRGGSEEGFVQVWDLLGGRCVERSDREDGSWGFGGGRNEDDRVLQWSADGKHLAASHDSSSINVWENGRVSARAKLMHTGNGSNELYCWHPEQFGVCLMQYLEENYSIAVCDFSPEAIDACFRGALPYLGDGSVAPERRSFPAAGSPRYVSFASQGVVYVMTLTFVRRVDAKTGEIFAPCGEVLQLSASVTGLRWSANETVCAVRKDENIAILSVKDGSVLSLLPGSPHDLLDVQFDAVGERVALIREKSVEIYTTHEPKRLAAFDRGTGRGSPPDGIEWIFSAAFGAFSRDGSLFARLRHTGEISLYNEQYKLFAKVPSGKKTIGMAFGTEDRVLLTWGENLVEVWSLEGLRFGKPVSLLLRLDCSGGGEDRDEDNWSTYSGIGSWMMPPVKKGEEVRDDSEFAGVLDVPTTTESWVFSKRGVRQVFGLYFSARHRCAMLVHPAKQKQRCASICGFVIGEENAWPLHWALGTKFVRTFDHWKGAQDEGLLPKEMDDKLSAFS